MVSTIFGLQLRLVTQDGKPAFTGEFAAAPFTNLGTRTFGSSALSGAGAMYQSQLIDPQGNGPVWSATPPVKSAFLEELQRTAGDLPLSIRFVVYGFQVDSTQPEFPTGRVVGTIGVAQPGEPRHFALGRQLYSIGQTSPVNNAVAIVAGDTLILDVANSFPVTADRGTVMHDMGSISVGTSTDGTSFVPLADVSYRDANWYAQSGGIAEVTLTSDQQSALAKTPLALAIIPPTEPITPTVIAAEPPSGDYVRADMFVFRAEPGQPFEVKLYTTQFGEPNDAVVTLALDPTVLVQSQIPPPAPKGPVPGKPENALAFPSSVQTRNGSATVRIETSPPNNPRGYIDGQVYSVRPTLASLSGPTGPFYNVWDTVSVLLFDKVIVPENPTWWGHVQPILQQYANLYPIMRNVLDLDDYASVIAHKKMLTMVFSLPEEHPNYMPVTRDLSPTKREILLKWLALAAEPPLGAIPPRLSAPSIVPEITVTQVHEPHANAAIDESVYTDDFGSKYTAMLGAPALRSKVPKK
jgi:hypothetical protein